MRLAAIDLGTVTSRLLIADVTDGKIHELKRHAIITHLGRGLGESGRISEDAIIREISACREFMSEIQAVEKQDGVAVQRIYGFATSAMRDAENQEQVRTALLEVGLDIEVITGEREAELSFNGAVSGFSQGLFPDHALVMSVDIGGGSTEVIFGSPTGELLGQSILTARSFNIGSRRVTDHFLINDPPTSTEITNARSFVISEMTSFFSTVGQRPHTIIAVAGTATTAVTLRDAMAVYDPWKVHGSSVTAQELTELTNRLAALSEQERSLCVGLEPARASVIIAGFLILEVILELSQSNAFVVSETDILHGMLLAHQNG